MKKLICIMQIVLLLFASSVSAVIPSAPVIPCDKLQTFCAKFDSGGMQVELDSASSTTLTNIYNELVLIYNKILAFIRGTELSATRTTSGDFFTQDMTGYSYVIVEVTGITGTVFIAPYTGSTNPSSNFTLQIINITGATSPGALITSNGIYYLFGAYHFVTMNLVFISAGNATVKLTPMAGPLPNKESVAVNQGIKNNLSSAWYVASTFSNKNITTNATTNVFNAGTILHTLNVNTKGVTSQIVIYDNTAASGTIVGTYDTTANMSWVLDAKINTGITAVTTGGTPADVSITYQ